jgi:hypothetical protein
VNWSMAMLVHRLVYLHEFRVSFPRTKDGQISSCSDEVLIFTGVLMAFWPFGTGCDMTRYAHMTASDCGRSGV